MTDPNQSRHLYYYLTSRTYTSAPVLIFEDYVDARDFLTKNRYRGYVMNTCWGFKTDQYQIERDIVEDHLEKD
jgi:hypothetical protein